ncbi:MAG: hypothetical protein ACE5DM_00050 [Candidatus Nanoarchaeia archaeon]
MIELENMNDLFKLISRNLRKDILCYAFGGNAMMHYGYKNATKDIDLIFDEKDAMEGFVRAIRLLGYKKESAPGLYPKEKNKPIMYTRGDERFDLFLKEVFQTRLSKSMIYRTFGRFDFSMKDNTLTVFVLSKEDIILMKSITQRERDFDDILTIVEHETNINWKLIVEEALWQADHGDGWVILDLEETLQRLKRYTLIKKEHFEMLYRRYSSSSTVHRKYRK